MRVFPVTTIGPTDEPVTLGQLRAQTRIDATAEDALLLGYLIAAREDVEVVTGRKLMSQTVTFTVENWWTGELILACAPVQAVTSITYTASDGTTATLSADDYISRTHLELTRIRKAHGAAWPTLGDDPVITITATVGYASANDVPEVLRHAIILLATHWHENREPVSKGNVRSTVNEMPFGVSDLLARQRVVF